MKAKLARKGLILAGVPLAFELIFLVALLFLFHQSEVASTKSLQSKLVVAESEALMHQLWEHLQQMGMSVATRKPLKSIPRTLEAGIREKFHSIRTLIG
ncbi:MAG: hypothetical protein K2Z81_08385, partial [Cyanobacteria bacterium]|nr:hypothetical protein [Cyanobacteriota bacterium]